MALVRCADCGKDRSDQAPACPYCGRPNPPGYGQAAAVEYASPRATGFALLALVIGVLIIAIVVHLKGPSPVADVPIVAGPSDSDLRVNAELAVQQQLRDPASAQFQNEVIRRKGDVASVCGEVNAKNGFGGYTGFTSFAVVGNLAVVQSPSSGKTFATVWNRYCTD